MTKPFIDHTDEAIMARLEALPSQPVKTAGDTLRPVYSWPIISRQDDDYELERIILRSRGFDID